MTPQEAVTRAYNGGLVECTAEEYPQVRTALQNAAAKWIDQKQAVRAQIALNEVRRLDALHGAPSLFTRKKEGDDATR